MAACRASGRRRRAPVVQVLHLVAFLVVRRALARRVVGAVRPARRRVVRPVRVAVLPVRHPVALLVRGAVLPALLPAPRQVVALVVLLPVVRPPDFPVVSRAVRRVVAVRHRPVTWRAASPCTAATPATARIPGGA